MTKLSDKLLLIRLKRKDPEAFGQFYDSYIEKIYRFIYFKVSSTETAQDLTSETFLKVWQSFTEGKKITHLQAFTYQVAKNLVVDHYRQQARTTTVSTDDETSGVTEIADDQPTAEAVVALAGDVEHLEAVLAQLKDEYREIIILKYLDELSTAEIADILGKTKGNVRVLAHRALQTLRELLEAQQPSHHEQ